MKKYIPYIAIIIIFIIIDISITYKATKDKIIEINNREIVLETVTMDSTDIKRYLSYIPYGYEGKSVYENNLTTKITIDSNYLLNMALGKIPITKDLCELREELCQDYYSFKVMNVNGLITSTSYNNNIGAYLTNKDNLNAILKDMYNMSIEDFELNDNYVEYIGNYNGICYAYFENSFSYIPCSSKKEIIHYITKAQKTTEELYIYEHALDLFFNEYTDLYSNNVYLLDNTINVYDTKKVKEYGVTIMQDLNEEELTTYKHTFKKNETGYYWYKTEVVE